MARTRKKEGINLFTVIIMVIVIVAIVSIIVNINKNNKNEQNVQNIQSVSEKQEEQKEEKNVQILEDGTKLNISSELNSNKKLDNLVISNIQLTYKNGVTNLLATVQNNEDKKIEMSEVEVELIDENGEKIYTLKGIIQEIEPGKNVKLNCSITADFANAYDFKITKK